MSLVDHVAALDAAPAAEKGAAARALIAACLEAGWSYTLGGSVIDWALDHSFLVGAA